MKSENKIRHQFNRLSVYALLQKYDNIFNLN